MNLASHIYCLANGKVLANGSPSELQKDQRVIDAYLGGH
jgi:branched-chain amino acid transport system ATP-binding protein